jgi:hypothetical protein
MKLIQNYIIAFEALASGRTLDDAYLLLLDLGYQDRIILVGYKGLTTLGRVCNEPEWAKQDMSEVLIRFRGGPSPETATKKTFTGSVRSLVVDRLLKTVESNGLECALEAIQTIWGIEVSTGESVDAVDGTAVAALTN